MKQKLVTTEKERFLEAHADFLLEGYTLARQAEGLKGAQQYLACLDEEDRRSIAASVELLECSIRR